jgi:hypothetical protein
MADTKKHAYERIDRLPPTQLSAVVGLLEAMLDPVSLANAAMEEEEITTRNGRGVGPRPRFACSW